MWYSSGRMSDLKTYLLTCMETPGPASMHMLHIHGIIIAIIFSNRANITQYDCRTLYIRSRGTELQWCQSCSTGQRKHTETVRQYKFITSLRQTFDKWWTKFRKDVRPSAALQALYINAFTGLRSIFTQVAWSLSLNLKSNSNSKSSVGQRTLQK